MDDTKTDALTYGGPGNQSRPRMEKAIRTTEGIPITHIEYKAVRRAAQNVVGVYLKKFISGGEVSKKRMMATIRQDHAYWWEQACLALEYAQPLVKLCAGHWKAEHILKNSLHAESAEREQGASSSRTSGKRKGNKSSDDNLNGGNSQSGAQSSVASGSGNVSKNRSRERTKRHKRSKGSATNEKEKSTRKKLTSKLSKSTVHLENQISGSMAIPRAPSTVSTNLATITDPSPQDAAENASGVHVDSIDQNIDISFIWIDHDSKFLSISLLYANWLFPILTVSALRSQQVFALFLHFLLIVRVYSPVFSKINSICPRFP